MQQQSQQQGRQAARDQAQRRNSMLEDRVLVRLAEHAWVGGDFKVQADGNMVTLSGTVPSEQTKQRILRVTRRTFGVVQVRDQLRVNPSVASPPATTVDDSVLTQRVAQQIARQLQGAKAGEDWWLTGWRVEGPGNRWTFTVEAQNGNIWLEGEVPHYSQMRQAIDAARNVQGVRSVRSNLEIDRDYYPVYGWYPGAYPGYAYAPYGPHAIDRDYYFIDADNGMNAHGFRGLHAVTGKVTKVDKQTGLMSLRTEQGATLDLAFPPGALQGVDQGDRLTVEVGFKEADTAGAASPATESSSQQRQK
jgi:hypothetical protein